VGRLAAVLLLAGAVKVEVGRRQMEALG